jgi:hypothetical protein
MIDERMLNTSFDAESEQLPFIEKLSDAVAYFYSYTPGNGISGYDSTVLIYWIDKAGICRHFAYIVSHDPPNSDEILKVIKKFIEREKASGCLSIFAIEFPEEIANQVRNHFREYIATGSPLKHLEEVIPLRELDNLFRLVNDAELTTIQPATTRDCVDGADYRVLVKTPQGKIADLCLISFADGMRLGRFFIKIKTVTSEHEVDTSCNRCYLL